MRLSDSGVVWMTKFPYITDFFFMVHTAYHYPEELVFVKMIKLSFEEDEVPSKVGIFLFGMPIIFYNKCHVLDKFYGVAAKYFTKHKLNRSGA